MSKEKEKGELGGGKLIIDEELVMEPVISVKGVQARKDVDTKLGKELVKKVNKIGKDELGIST